MTETTEEKRQESKIGKKTPTYTEIAVVVVVTLVVTWFLAAAVYGAGVGSSTPQSGQGSSNSGTTGPDYVYLSIDGNPDRNLSMDQYSPANFTVAANTLVIFVITNYDTGENPTSAPYNNVSGTVGGVEYLNGSTTGVSSIPSGEVAHTFSILSGPYKGFNAVMPAAGNTTPTVVQFSAYFNTTGVFTWQCMAPCDPTSMATPGYMQGTITVA